MSMHDQFFSDLLQSPEDWKVRSIFADWCEDNDQPEMASCLRWMVRARKRPERGSTGVGTWYNGDKMNAGLGDPESDLPGELYRCLSGGVEIGRHRAYANLTEAEQALHEAWLLACKQGWNPDV